jgi:hypothetical protein
MRLVLEVSGQKSVCLGPGDEIRIGRSPDCELRLPRPSVSRLHATVVWKRGRSRPSVVDERSANGVWLNEAQVLLRQSLGRGDVLEIGGVRILVHSAGPSSITEETDIMQFPGTTSEVGAYSSRQPFAAHLTKLERTGHTGTLDLNHGKTTGRLVFCLGRLVRARCGALCGRDALRLLVQLTHGDYHLHGEVSFAEPEFDLSITRYLAEGQRRRQRPTTRPA